MYIQYHHPSSSLTIPHIQTRSMSCYESLADDSSIPKNRIRVGQLPPNRLSMSHCFVRLLGKLVRTSPGTQRAGGPRAAAPWAPAARQVGRRTGRLPARVTPEALPANRCLPLRLAVRRARSSPSPGRPAALALGSAGAVPLRNYGREM